MGTEYYIVNKKDKTFYHIGKSCLSELQYDLDAFQDKEYLELVIEDCYRDVAHFSDEQMVDAKINIHNRIAPDLFEAFGKVDKKDICMIGDSTDDLTEFRSAHPELSDVPDVLCQESDPEKVLELFFGDHPHYENYDEVTVFIGILRSKLFCRSACSFR